MSNIEVYAQLLNDGIFTFHEKGDGCNVLVDSTLGDVRPAPKHLTFNIQTETGKQVELIIPNDPNATATVHIDGESI